MPAAAVIPAPIAYVKIAAVKKLVVGFLEISFGPWFLIMSTVFVYLHPCSECIWHLFVGCRSCIVYCEKIRVFKAGLRR